MSKAISKKTTIVICCSAAFYEHALEVAEKLQELGFRAVVPATAKQMKRRDDFAVDKVKTWYQNSADAHLKLGKMHAHFAEVAAGDGVLLINDDKPEQPSYIGPNGLMEWGLAVYLNKPVYILNAVTKTANYWEESLSACVIDGDLSKIKRVS